MITESNQINTIIDEASQLSVEDFDELQLKHTAQVSYPICFQNLFDGDSQSVVKDRLSIQVAANRAYAQLDYSLPSRKSEAVIKYLELKGNQNE